MLEARAWEWGPLVNAPTTSTNTARLNRSSLGFIVPTARSVSCYTANRQTCWRTGLTAGHSQLRISRKDTHHE